ncbi:hypothetical protein KP509_11G075700 [Ceratopteris richardii]|uniref:ATPase subunit I n=1 Tax=Ceratopteris richardii TaxID=49495 RepID=A0A8T2TR69_CERRI|nr:hypothetical protein KP509_11G075700 [Ceratopteris richardii]
MRSISEIFALLSYWVSAAGISLNTDIFEINLINLILVLSILFYYGKGVLLENHERTISNTIRDAEERYTEATEKLQKARIRLQQAKIKADEIRISGLAQMDKERQDLVDAADNDLNGLEDSKNNAICFEKQRAIEQVRQQVSRLASQRALESLNSCMTNQGKIFLKYESLIFYLFVLDNISYFIKNSLTLLKLLEKILLI